MREEVSSRICSKFTSRLYSRLSGLSGPITGLTRMGRL